MGSRSTIKQKAPKGDAHTWPCSDYAKNRSPRKSNPLENPVPLTKSVPLSKSFALLVLALLISLPSLSCAKNFGDGGVPRKTREQLISQLLEKAAHTSIGTRQTAYSAYRFAAFYAPQDKQIQAKYEEARKMPVGIVANVQETRDFLANWVRHEDFRDFPASTAETDLLNLEMLNDERLVGDLSYSVYSVSQRTLFATYPPADAGESNGEQVCVFTSAPNYSVAEVRKTYGETSVQGTNPNILTYGRFRLIATDSGQVRVVLFPLFPSR